MEQIGIERDTGRFYEGGFEDQHASASIPVIAPAAITTEAELPARLPDGMESADMVFREDSFEAVSRVRRGRLYTSSGTRPESVYAGPKGNRHAYVFHPFTGTQHRIEQIRSGGQQPLVVIGTLTSSTVWTVMSVEGTSQRTFLLTLRGRETIGALPILRVEAVPVAHRGSVRHFYSALQNDVMRSGPSSMVDRARDLAAAALSGYLQHAGVIEPGKDLGQLTAKLGAADDPLRKRIAHSAAEIVRLLHARGKSAERERRPGQRPIHEQDAQLAVYCAGTILCELGWAEWP